VTERVTTCTHHCSPCGRHFHSLAAFDAHRIGDFASDDPETRRRCQSPLDAVDGNGEMRLVALTEAGLCAAYEPPEATVTVWTMRDRLDRARATWGADA
jgi:hypothetical protein